MSNYVVSARKYRPSRFEEVLGQEQITSTLKNALRKGQLAHAFLFSGPRGVGKTTCARILAKVINCEQPNEQFEPCGTCDSCQAFAKNASFNVFEMDGASNNKVEHIHQLVEKVRVPPYMGKYKVFIIDEVHMLTTTAFNAFLKTLEEPPDYAIFILATTEKHKILPTILSRCQIYDFNRIGPDIIVKQLQQICEQEGITAEEEALYLIGVKADGAMRDALSIFDRISSASDKKITYKAVIQSLHILDFEHFFRFTDAFLTENLPAVITLLEEIVNKGFDEHQVLIGLSEHLRNLLMAKYPDTVGFIPGSEHTKGRMLEQSGRCSTGFLLSALDALNQADVHYPRADNKRLHLEMVLAKLTYIHRRINGALLETQEKKSPVISDKHVEQEAEPTIARQEDHDPSPKQEEEPSNTAGQTAVIEDKPPVTEEVPQSMEENTETSPIMQGPLVKEGPEDPGNPLDEAMKGPRVIASKKRKLDDLIPRIPRLDNLESQIAEEGKKNGNGIKGIGLEKVKNIWMEYAEKCPSPSIKQTLKQAVLEIKEKTVLVQLGSQLEKNIVLQETALMDAIRSYYDDYDISLSITVVRQATKDEPVKNPFMTDKEKYEKMVAENPDLVNFIHRFDMKLVNE